MLANKLRKLSFEMSADVAQVEGFEATVLALVESDQERHDFAVREGARTATLARHGGDERELLTKIVETAKQVDETFLPRLL